MVQVKLQKRAGLRSKYFTYVITLPKSIVEALPKLQKSKYIELTLRNEDIILKVV